MTSNLIMSFTIQDAKGAKSSLPVYAMYDEGTVTLADILAYMDTLIVQVDAITEGKIVSQSLTLYPVLPAGLKANPVANSDIQEGGLITYPLTGLTSKSFSVFIPAFIQSAFVGENINLANTDVAAFNDSMTAHVQDVVSSDDVWAHFLETERKGVKSFRKRG